MSYPLLKEALKNKNLPHLMHFFGEETYLKHHYINLVKAQLVDDLTADFNFVLFEDDITANDLGTALETPPMMSDSKLILIKNTGIFKGKSGDWASVFADVPDYAYVLADEENVDKRSAAYKAFSPNALSVDFELRKPGELKAWVGKILAKNQKDISPSDLDYFLDVAGTDMYSISAQADKVLSYVGHRKKIEREDIDATVTKSLMTKEYSLTDALLTRNKKEAFILLGELFDMRTDPVRLLHIISSAFLSAYKAGVYLSDGANRAQAAAALGIPNRFIADKYVKYASSGDGDFYKKVIDAASDTDYRIKLGLVAPHTGIEMLCAQILE